MSAGLANCIRFDPNDPGRSLGGLPEAAGIFALCAADPAAQPYLGKTPNLRRRLMRFLRGTTPGMTSVSKPGTTKGATPATRRLQLAHLVDHIEYSVTGSAFESSLCLYEASLRAFGEQARKRLRLRPPAFLRMAVQNAYPRVYATNKISKAAEKSLFGPFPSRAAAERFAEEMLNLFLLRRCFQDLDPDPAFPGCVYSEMKMCLAPCFEGCTNERYQQEATAVFEFLATRGASLLAQLEQDRQAASEAMEFERAAAIHQRISKVQAVAHQASDAVRPLAGLSGILVQPAAEPDRVVLFVLQRGVWRGSAPYSILGMRLANERSGSSSLFAHPFAMEAVPLEGAPPASAKGTLEARLEAALLQIERAAAKTVTTQTLCDHLALFTQWFYRPAARTTGEMVFASNDGDVARKPLLRAISRVAARANSANPQELAKPPIQWHA